MLFFSADHHFGETGIIGFCNRPFESSEEMDDAMIRRHNDRVERSDDVYFLGDFSSSYDVKYLQHIFERLKGRKHLVIGNHDCKQVLRLNWSSAPAPRKIIKDNEGQVFNLSHYSERSWDRMYRGAFHLYGHTHGKLPGIGKSTDVGVDAWDFAPATSNEVIERMMLWNSDFDTYAPEEAHIITGPAMSLSM